jgi:mRNA-decapping enzyme subunit 2
MAESLSLGGVLNDLCSRFLINIPEEEREDVIRVCFHVEQMHWFYLDFFWEQDPALPNFSMLEFLRRVFLHYEPLRHRVPATADIYQQWRYYKVQVPVCGAIMFNPQRTHVLLVKSWGAKGSWSFPRGKINKNESEIACAIREVYEETSFDLTNYARESDVMEMSHGGQTGKLFLVVGVPEEFVFAPRTRKEISQIQWHRVDDLPASKEEARGDKGLFYMVYPFVTKLRKWLSKYGEAAMA